jgi:4-amino-4-deoxy-L-arabinose transferase-like glycosyltransferase
VQFLLCWAAVYCFFFSLSSTKLPNYILPAYPAAALLTARFLARWAAGTERPPAWAAYGGLVFLALIGVGVAVGLEAAGGGVAASWLRGRVFPGVEWWAGLGLIPIAGAAAAGLLLRRRQTGKAIAAVTATAVLFTAATAAGGPSAVEAWKAPRGLAAALPSNQLLLDSRVAAYGYFQPSLIFYCRREVHQLDSDVQAVDFLRQPPPSFLLTPKRVWDGLEAKVVGTHRVLTIRRDLYSGEDVVLVSNE